MRLACCASLLLFALTACEGSGTAVAHSRFDALASRSLTEIQHGDCSPTAKDFDATIKDSLTAPGLCTAFLSYTQQFGELVNAGTPYSTKRGQITVVRIPLSLGHTKGEFRVAYHPEGTIAGIYFLKPGVPLP